MALFSESPGTFTIVYPDFFDEDENLKDENSVPPSMISYHRSKGNGLLTIDSEYNLIGFKVKFLFLRIYFPKFHYVGVTSC